MMLFPNLKCDNAPPVNFMQGQIDMCVNSSLASAFHHTNIPDLLRAAKYLMDNSNRLCGSTKCLETAKKLLLNMQDGYNQKGFLRISTGKQILPTTCLLLV
jgi:hypothetical protein